MRLGGDRRGPVEGRQDREGGAKGEGIESQVPRPSLAVHPGH